MLQCKAEAERSSSLCACSLQLRICKDCRYNVLAQYKLALAAGRKAAGLGRASTDGGGGGGKAVGTCGADSCANDGCAGGCETTLTVAPPPSAPLLPMCEGFSLAVTDANVQLVGTNAAVLLEEAEEIEDLKVRLPLASSPIARSLEALSALGGHAQLT